MLRHRLALLGFLSCLASYPAAAPAAAVDVAQPAAIDVAAIDRQRVLSAAERYLSEAPLTIAASHSPRSAGGLHDFFSEGDYWWPDPDHPAGPYIQRDGLSNPDNFNEHRRVLLRLSVQVPALVAAWSLTNDPRYARHAAAHLRAWFIDPDTHLNPNLQYAQAIYGRSTGRGIGIIDTLHLVEVARAIEVLEPSGALSASDLAGIKQWFADYTQWLTTSKNGIDERNALNNHGTCWLLQVAAFAHLTGDQQLLAYCRDRYKTVLLKNQLAADGSFPLELRRTKPYGYALFNLEAMAALCEILSTPTDNLWTYTLSDGRGMQAAMAYMVPYIRDKKSWPLPPDVMYDREWPMRQSSLLFAGRALGRDDYLALWQTLPADSSVDEVIRNFFIRQPLLWQAARPALPKLDTAAAPGSNFNLAPFTLQLPTGWAGKIDTVSGANLAAGYTNPHYFYTDSADGAMVMIDPAQGWTTSGSKHPRTELREAATWTSAGINQLNATVAVPQVPHHTAIGQIFQGSGPSKPLCELQVASDGVVRLLLENTNQGGSSTVHGIASVVPGARFDYELGLTGTTITVKVGGAVQSFTMDASFDGERFYFKAGDYDQSAVPGAPSTSPGTIVKFYALALTHR